MFSEIDRILLVKIVYFQLGSYSFSHDCIFSLMIVYLSKIVYFQSGPCTFIHDRILQLSRSFASHDRKL